MMRRRVLSMVEEGEEKRLLDMADKWIGGEDGGESGLQRRKPWMK